MNMMVLFKYVLIIIVFLLMCSCKDNKTEINIVGISESSDSNMEKIKISDTHIELADSTGDDVTAENCCDNSTESQQGSDTLTNFFDYLKVLYAEYSLQKYEINGETYLKIYFLDFNNDNIQDALVETLSGNGLTCFIIENVNDPILLYDFGSFDRCNLYKDSLTGQIIINYTSNYGLMTYSTTEMNFIILGDEISYINFVHFFGTVGKEEFYVESNDEKKMLSEEEFNELIMITEQNLLKFSVYDSITVKFSDSCNLIFIDN